MNSLTDRNVVKTNYGSDHNLMVRKYSRKSSHLPVLRTLCWKYLFPTFYCLVEKTKKLKVYIVILFCNVHLICTIDTN